MHGETEKVQKSGDIDTRKLARKHEIARPFHKKKKKRNDVRHVITNETGKPAKTHAVFMPS